MRNSTRPWQLLSLVLAGNLFVTLLHLHHTNAATQPAECTLPTVNKMPSHEHLALSPNARRIHERYSL
ncbi:hypothetical protein [Pseudomonas mosselii]|uniref:hypothetical protein n=1 Tax=Pseudomonas mosselii TaxID=78327 RepID=UPI002448C6A6|nr:hypothetical protein [Pseudomonas mosselii]MDH1530196.1 hypothetical protein [Pseudomonas mosselii]